MKTNPIARRVLKTRKIALCLALVGTVGIAFASGQTLATRVTQYAAIPQTQGPQAPTVDLGVVMASVR